MPRTGLRYGFASQGHKNLEQYAGEGIGFTRRRLLLHTADRPELRSALLRDPALAELGDYLVHG